MSHGRKERTPAQLAVLAQAREKANIVIAERAKLNALQKTAPEPVSGEEPPPPPTLEPVSVSENEDEEPRLTRPKYRFVHGVGYIKIK